jgi:hypothetical protein
MVKDTDHWHPEIETGGGASPNLREPNEGIPDLAGRVLEVRELPREVVVVGGEIQVAVAGG